MYETMIEEATECKRFFVFNERGERERERGRSCEPRVTLMSASEVNVDCDCELEPLRKKILPAKKHWERLQNVRKHTPKKEHFIVLRLPVCFGAASSACWSFLASFSFRTSSHRTH